MPGENDAVEAVTARGDTVVHTARGGCAHTLGFSPAAPVVFTQDREYLGSMGGSTLVAPIVGIAGT